MAATDKDLCDKCKRHEQQSIASFKDYISPKGCAEYEIVQKTTLARADVKRCMRFWDDEAEKLRAANNLPKKFPYFKAKAALHMLAYDSYLLFTNSKTRAYKRTAIQMAEQEAFLLEVMQSMLTILRFEGRDNFVKRWQAVKKVASRIHTQMSSFSEHGHLGAIQATDVIGEELKRAAVRLSLKRSARAVSRRMQTLASWALDRKMANGGASSTDSISSPETEPQVPSSVQTETAPLEFSKVQNRSTNDDESHANESLTGVADADAEIQAPSTFSNSKQSGSISHGDTDDARSSHAKGTVNVASREVLPGEGESAGDLSLPSTGHVSEHATSGRTESTDQAEVDSHKRDLHQKRVPLRTSESSKSTLQAGRSSAADVGLSRSGVARETGRVDSVTGIKTPPFSAADSQEFKSGYILSPNGSVRFSEDIRQLKPTIRRGDSIFKKLSIKESTIPDAGRGLFIHDAASDGEEIARYSGKLINAAQAAASSSECIVKVADDMFMDGRGDDEWEGQYANCGRKSKRTINARFAPGMKIYFCPKELKFFLVVLAVGSIPRSADGEELFIDYNDEYWSGDQSLSSPELNEDRSPSDDDNDSDFTPSSRLDFGVPRSYPTRSSTRTDKRKPGSPAKLLTFSTEEDDAEQYDDAARKVPSGRSDAGAAGLPAEQQPGLNGSGGHSFDKDPDSSKKDTHSRDSEKRTDKAGRVKASGIFEKVYAVGVGRCVGLFKLPSRVTAVTFEFSGCESKRCSSIQEARLFLRRFGIESPVSYWNYSYETGSLVSDPTSVIGRPVFFPVGQPDEFYQHKTPAFVVATAMRHDMQAWKIQMPNGITDWVQEWPLLCGLQRYVSSCPVTAQQPTFIAIRGTMCDGIVTDESLLRARLTGPSAESKRFCSRDQAYAWIDEANKVTSLRHNAVRPTRSSASYPRRGVNRSVSHQDLLQQQVTPKVFAIRGGEQDGIVHHMQSVGPRLLGGNAVYKEFNSVQLAQQWIDDEIFFVITYPDGTAVVSIIDEVSRKSQNVKGVQISSAMSFAKASHAAKTHNAGTFKQRSKDKSSTSAASTQQSRIFAIRGGSQDGIVTEMSLVGPRLGAAATFQEFNSRAQAELWLAEEAFSVVTFPTGVAKVVHLDDVSREAQGVAGVRISAAMSFKDASQAATEAKWNEDPRRKHPAPSSKAQCAEPKSDMSCIANM